MPICTRCGQANPEGFRFCGACAASLEAEAASDQAESAAVQPDVAVVTAPEPTSFVGGRYEVRRSLGEGGKKKVYLAHDTVLDRDVAFALIKTEGLDETARTRIGREAQAMGRLGSHPHIVTVFDLGEEDGRPYMVTELMEGGDVEGLIGQAPDHVPLEEAVEIAKAVCQGLEFAYVKHLVHRDLKPGNVWLTADGVAKIGDFGLALAQDRSRLTEEGLMVGTAAYMPPEQALGGEVGLRSDLYALGAMLYELVTGRPPFLGDNSVAIIGQHINTPPVAPSWHDSRCPKPLEALIMRLLAKDPAERPGSVADVLQALEAIDTEAESGEREPREGEEPSLDSLAAGVFVGRQKEMSELKAALEDALSGRGCLALLVGEPGIGKTRTAFELSTYARLRRAQVVQGRCYESEGAPPYWPWVQAIRSYVRERDPDELRSEMGAGAAEIAELVSDVRERLPDLGPTPALTDPKQARFRLFDAITAFLRSAAGSQPLVLILDDLHWADNDSLALLEFVAHELAGARLLVVGTYRDVELSRRHPLSQTLAELTREHLAERILLRGLSEEDVGGFIAATSGIAPPVELVQAVHSQTEGNPLFVTEVVRLLVQEGALTPERLGGHERWSVGIPEGIREVIGRRLDRLSERCNSVLTVAAVIGREFGYRELSRLIDDLSDERLLGVLEEALSARVIEELPRALERYQFTHALIQEVLAQELSTTRRVRLHAEIAQALDELYGADAEAHAAELAHHYVQAESLLGTDKLLHYSQAAGERALATHAYEEAIVHFERALAAKERQPADAQAADLLFGLARSELGARELFDLGEVLAHIYGAFDYYADAGETERAVEIAAHPLPPTYVSTEVPERIARALTMVTPDSLEEGRLLSSAGWFAGTHEGNYESAREAFERSLAIARRLGDAALERRALVSAAQVDYWNLNWQGCWEKGLRAAELALAANDQHTEMVAREWLARVALVRGDPDQGQLHTATAVELAERLRERSWLASVHIMGMLVPMLEGDWQAARDFSDHGLALQPREVRNLAIRALFEFQVGDFTEGDAYLERLLDPARRSAWGLWDQGAVAAFVPLIARITGGEARFDIAEAEALAALSSTAAPERRDLWPRIGLGLIAVQRGDAAVAAEHYAWFEHQRGTAVIGLGLAVDRLLGLLSRTMGQLDTALAHFDDALAFCKRAGYRPEYGWTASDYSDALLERGSPGDRERAVALQDDALAVARELGMRPLMERVLASREIIKA